MTSIGGIPRSPGLQGDLLSELDVAAIGVDAAGTIDSWNGAAARLYGRPADQMLGTPIHAVRLARDDGALVASILSDLARVGRWRGLLVIADGRGRPRSLDVRAAVRVDGDRRPAGVEAVFLDVSGRVEAEQRGADGAWRLGLAHQVAGLGSWEWDPVEDQLLTSDSFTELLGLAPGTVLTMTDAMASMLPGDRDRVWAALEGMRRGETDSFSAEYRVRGTDGTVHWLEAHCGAVRAHDGRLARVRGMTQDVTVRVLAAEQLRDAKEFGLATLDSLSAHIAVLDEGGEIIAVNAAWRAFAAHEGGESDYVGHNYIAACVAAEDPVAQEVARGLSELLTGQRDALDLDYSCHSPSQQRWFRLRATRYSGSGPTRLVIAHADVSDRRLAQEQATIRAALLDEIDVAVVVTDPELRVVSWNAGAERLYGWTAQEAIGRSAAELEISDHTVDPEPILDAIRREGRWESDYTVHRRDGSSLPVYLRNRAMLDADGEVTAFVGVGIDISERKESERALLSARNYLLAVTDSIGEGVFTQDPEGRVTYLNQVAEDLLGWSLAELRGRIMHDLTHFRRPDGSPLAIEDCPILRARRNGEVVRVADDVFIRQDGRELPVSYTAAPFSTDDGLEGCVVVFEDITERKAVATAVKRDLDKLAWVGRIQAALTENRLVLLAQPIIDLRTGAVEQHEMLLRMRSAEQHEMLIAPGAFLPVAEEYGSIIQIDRWVIDRGSELAAAGHAVQINVSGRSISDPSLGDYIALAMARTAADPARLVFEITETALVSDEDASRAFVERVHKLGCRVALDDFGTGYGGFTYLKQLPIDYLKIDIEFVRDLRENDASRHVVQGIVSLARGFGLKTVGEGVEEQETLELLRELGVDYGQGFHIGRPAPLKTEPGHVPKRGQQ